MDIIFADSQTAKDAVPLVNVLLTGSTGREAKRKDRDSDLQKR